MNFNDIIWDSGGRLRSGWRFTIFSVGFIGLLVFLGSAAFALQKFLSADVYRLASVMVVLVAALLVGWLCAKHFEGLPFRSLGASFTKGWIRHLIIGLLMGGASLGFAVLVAYVFGGLRFETNSVDAGPLTRSMVSSFVFLAVAAASEEALFRGYPFQTFVRSGLAWFAIVLTSALFGAVHLLNPEPNWISTVNTILAGIWFAIAYLKTRDLWLVTGMHFMWNWMQGALFGIEVSGFTDLAAVPLLREIDSGPAWLTGRTYGIEGGVAATIALVVSMVVLYLMPIRPADEMKAGSEPPAVAGG
jgi:membrane protease YdiL (CAAX protease family)